MGKCSLQSKKWRALSSVNCHKLLRVSLIYISTITLKYRISDFKKIKLLIPSNIQFLTHHIFIFQMKMFQILRSAECSWKKGSCSLNFGINNIFMLELYPKLLIFLFNFLFVSCKYRRTFMFIVVKSQHQTIKVKKSVKTCNKLSATDSDSISRDLIGVPEMYKGKWVIKKN